MVTTTVKEVAVSIVFETGVNEKGAAVFEKKRIRNVNPAANVSSVYAFAKSLAEFSTYPMVEVNTQIVNLLEKDGE
ncbi:MAG: DUF1659 domain-containing protein [Bacilli bacterium]